VDQIRFARAATRHRISKESIRSVIANYRVTFEEPPPAGSGAARRSPRLVYLGSDVAGHVLEVMAVQLANDTLLVIHAMPIRGKYRTRYEETPWTQ